MSNNLKQFSLRPAHSSFQTFNRFMTSGYTIGVDGGGTKTRAIVLALNELRPDSGGEVEILGEGMAGASNPLRSSIATAADAVRQAIELACADADIELAQVARIEIGLAGVRKSDVRRRVREALKAFDLPDFHITTDADIALYGATQGTAGVVVIAGTGSVCCGQDARGRKAYAGGWGPLAGDEGSASWIARRTLQRVAQAADGRSSGETLLTKAVSDYFGLASLDDLSSAIYHEEMTHTRIAGLGRFVIEAARAGDAAAIKIINEAGRELGKTAAAVVRQLKLNDKELRVAYVGGVFAAEELVLAPMREELKSLAETLNLAAPRYSPAVAAALLARRQVAAKLALAG